MKITESNLFEFFDFFSRRFFYWILWIAILNLVVILFFEDPLYVGMSIGSMVTLVYIVLKFPTIYFEKEEEGEEKNEENS